MLNFLALAGKCNFQLELVGAGEIRRRAIKSHEGRHVDRQTLFDIGRFEHGALDADGAVRRRLGEPNSRQRTGGAIRPNAGVDADAHILAGRRPERAID